jgi:preprotein translocase subunit SecG
MQTVLIVIHLMIVLALVGVVLIQRSEGGGLGIGGGGGSNFMSARGSGNGLTRVTAVLATAFFITSLTLGIMARYDERPSDILDRIESQTQGTGGGILDQLGGSDTTTPSTDVPAQTPAPAPQTGSDIPSSE